MGFVGLITLSLYFVGACWKYICLTDLWKVFTYSAYLKVILQVTYVGKVWAVLHRDDMVLHDDIVMLFPQYWKEVPKAFEYIAVGQIPRAFGVSNKLVTGQPALRLTPFRSN